MEHDGQIWCERCGKCCGKEGSIHTCSPNPVITSLREQLAATQAEVEALRGVMQQAREALVDSVDLVREDYLTDWRHGIPTRAAQLEGKKAELDRHEQTIAAIDAAMQPAADEAGKGGDDAHAA